LYGHEKYNEESEIHVAPPEEYVNRGKRNSRMNKPGPKELIPGYYMLNEGATGRNGVPRYVYLGPDEP
jgi:hypothetical protein